MNLFESIEHLEHDEEQLKQAVQHLTDEQRKTYFTLQSKHLKDPDTYAVLTWFCVGGFHHLYLGRYFLFLLEISFLLVAILLLVIGIYWAGLGIIIILAAIELPQLFLSQKIVRLKNYAISRQIYQQIKQ